jgi:hypothetical protein
MGAHEETALWASERSAFHPGVALVLVLSVFAFVATLARAAANWGASGQLHDLAI